MLYALTIFVSAFLLFLVQPLIAKQILPWFGGTAAVWTVCLVFFQFVLLAGYIYADLLSRLAVRRQAIIHTVVVVAACLMLPIIPDAAWKPVADADPTSRILALLAATIGLPYLVVCTTGPLVQSWFAKVHANDAAQSRVYRLFALSNLASLVALVAYPFALEPFISLRVQSWAWSGGFGVFAVLVISSAWATQRKLWEPATASLHVSTISDALAPSNGFADTDSLHERANDSPSFADYALWLLLAALGTVMLLAITTHITQDVASVPFLWILPLALYLLTFILCFDSDFWYRRWLFWPAVIVLAPLMAWGIRAGNGILAIQWALPLFCGGLFAVCMFCHGELVRSRPAPAWLTRFYLMISLGGALGGLFVGVIAPRIFSGSWELPIALAATGLLLWRVAAIATSSFSTNFFIAFSMALVLGFAWFAQGYLKLAVNQSLYIVIGLSALMALLLSWRKHSVRAGATLLAGLSAAFCAWLGWNYAEFIVRDTALMQRNFYGVLRVKEYGKPGDDSHAKLLVHGVISHGEQYTADPMRKWPTSYYGESSGVGLAIAKVNWNPQRIGVVGLGAGTLAAYGSPGGTVRYYEINPAVLDIANSQFTYLKNSASRVETVLGDARLSLEAEAAAGQFQKFDVLVVDAFSSDSIPVHLMTREAMAVYVKHIRPSGVIAFHVSNRYLNLPPVVAALAQDAGMQAIYIDDVPDKDRYWQRTTDYVLVTRNKAFLNDPAVKARAQEIAPIPGLKIWTDDYNNLFLILK